MRVLHLSNSDLKGGAAKAAFRLNEALNMINFRSDLLVKLKESNDTNVFQLSNSKKYKALAMGSGVIDKFLFKIYKNRDNITYSSGLIGFNLKRNEIYQKADLIHIHWINNGFISLKMFKRIIGSNKPIVWTLHDSWGFTGGCHIRLGCEKYKNKCRRCPRLKSKSNYDLSTFIFNKKMKTYQGDFTVVSPSNWLANKALESALLKNKKIEVIPNPINVDIFKPVDKKLSRNFLNLNKGKFYILVLVSNTKDDQWKGIDYLVKSLKKLATLDKYDEKVELIVFGTKYSKNLNKLPFKINYMGYLNDDLSLSLVYNAADIFVTASIEDNFPNTILESLSCSTPVVAFDVGGINDLIDHKSNGYLANSKDSSDLLTGIKWFIEKQENMRKYKKNARDKVLKNYSYLTVGNKYMNLYNQLLD